MDRYKLITEFIQSYVSEMGDARHRDDWDEMSLIRREAQLVVREMSALIKAVDTMERYGIKLS
jgi:hypothetical protein